MEGGGLHKRGGEYFKMEGTHLELACWSLTFSSRALSVSAFRGSDNWGMVNAGWPGYAYMYA